MSVTSTNVTNMNAKPVIGPLPTSKTITITFVPDWSQEDMKSPLRAASICVLLGPANTLPQEAPWSIEFNLFAADKSSTNVRHNEETISKNQRALLWHDGKPFPKYKNCLVISKCRQPINDDLKTVSVVLRSHGEESDPNALTWVKKKGNSNRKDLSYLKVIAGHHYYLNLTFAAGSSIAQMVGDHAWRPIVYLYTKRQKKGIDEIQSSRLFTNFTTNWAVGIEPHVDERELNLAVDSLLRESDEDAEYNLKHKTDCSRVSEPTVVPASQVATQFVYQPPRNLTDMSLYTGTGYFNIGPSPESIIRNFATKASSYQQMLNPMNPHLYQLQTRSDIPIEWPELSAAIHSKPLTSIILPSLDKRSYPDLPFDPFVERFMHSEESALASALQDIERNARDMAVNTNHPLSDIAKHFLNYLSATSQLPGWQHVQNFIHNPQLYIERIKSAENGSDALINCMNNQGPIDEIQKTALSVLRKLYRRVDWVLELQTKASKSFDAEFYLKVIAADRAWADEASLFMKEAETKVTEMLTKNPQKFYAFRELQRKGVAWPHSASLRLAIESAGFVFRPMMIKRDRCVCETCKVEVSGWKTYNNPMSFHNYAKHAPSFGSSYQANYKAEAARIRAVREKEIAEANAAREKAEREEALRLQAERERIERERREEVLRIRAERERIERERIEHEKAERERIERERLERVKYEHDRIERYRAIDAERNAKHKADLEKAKRELEEREKAILEASKKAKEDADKLASEAKARKEQEKAAAEKQVVVVHPMHQLQHMPSIPHMLTPAITSNLFSHDMEAVEAFNMMITKGKEELKHKKERNLILNNANLKEYYTSFNERFLELTVSCYSIHSGMVENGTKNAADFASAALEKSSNALPILGLITSIFSSAIKTVNDIDKRHMINHAMAFFRKAIHGADQRVSMDDFAEIIARRLTIAQFKLIINTSCDDRRGMFSTFKDKVTANDVHTDVQKKAFEDIKSLFKLIFTGLKTESHDCTEELIKAWSNHSYRSLSERTEAFLSYLNPVISANGLPMSLISVPVVSDSIISPVSASAATQVVTASAVPPTPLDSSNLSPAFLSAVQGMQDFMTPRPNMNNMGVQLTTVVPTLVSSSVLPYSQTQPVMFINHGTVINNHYPYMPPQQQAQQQPKDEAAKAAACCVIL